MAIRCAFIESQHKFVYEIPQTVLAVLLCYQKQMLGCEGILSSAFFSFHLIKICSNGYNLTSMNICEHRC